MRFIAVTDNFDNANPSSTSGIMLPLKNMINEAYAIDIGRKIRAQAHQDMLDGNFVGARVQFGYRKDSNNCHKLLIDEATAPIVHQIFEWSAAGVGVNVIAIRLNEMKAVTASEYKRVTTEPNKRYNDMLIDPILVARASCFPNGLLTVVLIPQIHPFAEAHT